MECPARFYNVSQSHLSIVRLTGACRYDGMIYYYEPQTDTLVREDVQRRERRAAAVARQQAAHSAREAQLSFFDAATKGNA